MMNTAMVKGSIAELAQQSNKPIAESFLSAEAIIIIDTSGSMEMKDAPGGQSRHDAAEQQLRSLQRNLPGKIAVVAFSGQAQFCPSGIPIRFNGGTNMAAALRFVKPADGLGIKFVLISDGWPNDAPETLQVARTFTTKIDTVFIGPEVGPESRGRRFLAELADATGGQAAVSAQPAMLLEPVEQLLLSD